MAKQTKITPRRIGNLPTGAVGVACTLDGVHPAWRCQLTGRTFPRAETLEQAEWMEREAQRFREENGINGNYSLGEK